ncbi:hypothetical protein QVD99_001676 [Batrachochytrium dendrobatidis]|nr:hypothetical protein O5D80_000323 [Batrachochytrium dendrobatidis]KAK5671845.1 hypothetical protein QVD99_001676 [Batrachochytrium dendrobatidis]
MSTQPSPTSATEAILGSSQHQQYESPIATTTALPSTLNRIRIDGSTHTDHSFSEHAVDSAATMHVVEPLDRSNTEYNSAVEDLTHQLQQRDVEIRQLRTRLTEQQASMAQKENQHASQMEELQAKNAKLEELVLSLRESLAESNSKLTVLPTSGRPLAHMTKWRSNPRNPIRQPNAQSSTENLNSNDDNNSVNRDELQLNVVQPSNEDLTKSDSVSQHKQESETSQEALRKKMVGMGGMNPLLPLGFHPGAIKLRPSSSINLIDGSRASESSFSGSEVSEPVVRAWLYSVLADEDLAPDSGVSLRESLRDGKLLCKLANAISCKESIKINMGRFPIMHMENIAGFLGVVESMGIPRHQLFSANDLYDGTDMPRVVQTLDTLKKVHDTTGKSL